MSLNLINVNDIPKITSHIFDIYKIMLLDLSDYLDTISIFKFINFIEKYNDKVNEMEGNYRRSLDNYFRNMEIIDNKIYAEIILIKNNIKFNSDDISYIEHEIKYSYELDDIENIYFDIKLNNYNIFK